MAIAQYQIDQAFLIFLAYVEKHGKAWVGGYLLLPLPLPVGYTSTKKEESNERTYPYIFQQQQKEET